MLRSSYFEVYRVTCLVVIYSIYFKTNFQLRLHNLWAWIWYRLSAEASASNTKKKVLSHLGCVKWNYLRNSWGNFFILHLICIIIQNYMKCLYVVLIFKYQPWFTFTSEVLRKYEITNCQSFSGFCACGCKRRCCDCREHGYDPYSLQLLNWITFEFFCYQTTT